MTTKPIPGKRVLEWRCNGCGTKAEAHDLPPGWHKVGAEFHACDDACRLKLRELQPITLGPPASAPDEKPQQFGNTYRPVSDVLAEHGLRTPTRPARGCYFLDVNGNCQGTGKMERCRECPKKLA